MDRMLRRLILACSTKRNVWHLVDYGISKIRKGQRVIKGATRTILNQ